MSNLGRYQTMTTMAKKVGGPEKLGIIFLVLGGVVTILGGVATKALSCGAEKLKEIRHGRKVIKVQAATDSDIFIVTSEGKDSSGLEFHAGDKFKVLEHDGEAILIEKIEDANNPYFVSDEFLKTVCDNYGKEM